MRSLRAGRVLLERLELQLMASDSAFLASECARGPDAALNEALRRHEDRGGQKPGS
eukprot:CAMPEP_0170593826 /NCGR_PEP_ID=MMETSP0224-20130122/13671_1 /TAXON_ID=285029 /ORGANISM="Togula jolla, Strain CCCM 725" /LENGTH=55 /DNA_ID=CAMNT_0010917837 /DNA_START=23 /DNA_END=187 /DNA_ORIENTATION=+